MLMKTYEKFRRNFLVGISGIIGTSFLGSRAVAAILTPSAAEGPYYPTQVMRTPDIDNDLVKIIGLVEEAGGEVFTLRGKITDKDGHHLKGRRIEIWQCDVNGNYMHPRDSRSGNFDPAFQGFGHDFTDDGGNYVFRTIKPTIYPGRAPHIHIKVFDGNRELLTTQFYIKNDPNNSSDGLFNRMSKAEADAVSMEFLQSENGTEATVNIVV